jgi:3-oxoacyl-[acyl-carrier-protein] synthase-3
VLLVAMESMTRTVDYSDRSAAVLWGDAGLAAVLSPRHPGRATIIASTLDSSPAGNDKVLIPREGYFAQEGRTVQMFAIKRTSLCYNHLRTEYEDPDRPLHFIGHQANLRMLESVCQRCDIAPDRHHSNAEWYGNTGAASSGSVLSQSWDKWRDEDDVAVVGVGSGLSWGSYFVRFGAGDAR